MKIKNSVIDIASYIIIIIITFCFVLMISSAIIVYVDIIRTKDLSFCFSEKCIIDAQKIFKTPITFLEKSLTLIPVFVFFIGLYNYKLAIINSKNNNILNKERDFYTYLKENSNDQEKLINTLNKKKLFNALFDEQLNFKPDAKERIDFYFKTRRLTGLLDSLTENKKEIYKENLITTLIHFGFNIDKELNIERLDEITHNICLLLIEIIDVWFSITLSKD
ncbi:retron Ec48 family effector membrane protein [Dickeya undicola]|uniref:retron Ec48 family effector membrane protein n=1 Tax=Dickeya undicola TaxID=1577887 RepID=UPI003F2388F3